MKKQTSGYLYILTNQTMKRAWIKLVKSESLLDKVDGGLEIFACIKTKKYNEVERFITNVLNRMPEMPKDQEQGIYEIFPQIAVDILSELAEVIVDAEITKN